jgi:hypothetical protein
MTMLEFVDKHFEQILSAGGVLLVFFTLVGFGVLFYKLAQLDYKQ